MTSPFLASQSHREDCLSHAEDPQHSSRPPRAPSFPLSAIAQRTLPQEHRGFGRHTRRLQLRNARFRGVPFSSRNISPSSDDGSQTSHDPICTTQIGRRSPRFSLSGIGGPDVEGSPVTLNILEEVITSTGKLRSRSITTDGSPGPQSKTDCFPIYSDLSSEEMSPATQAASILCSFAMTDDQKLREVSHNSQPPTEKSSREKQLNNVKVRQKHSQVLRFPSSGSSKYIEYLETQLATAQKEIASLTSPPQAETSPSKYQIKNSEIRHLKDQVTEWESRFDARIEEALYMQRESESVLRTQLRNLEQQIDITDGKNKELEREVEKLQNEANENESLKAENVNLGKRIDLLTGILAQSPTKLNFTAQSPSCESGEQRERRRRPASMMPRIPSSPATARVARFSDSTQHDDRRYSSPMMMGKLSMLSPEDGITEESEASLLTHSPVNLQSNKEVTIIQTKAIMTSNTHRSRFSPLVIDTNIPPSSQSTTPCSASSTKATPRQRRVRRFPSGSSGPKALILPATAHCGSRPASAPPATVDEVPEEKGPLEGMQQKKAALAPPSFARFQCCIPTSQGASASDPFVATTGERQDTASPSDESVSPIDGEQPPTLFAELQRASAASVASSSSSSSSRLSVVISVAPSPPSAADPTPTTPALPSLRIFPMTFPGSLTIYYASSRAVAAAEAPPTLSSLLITLARHPLRSARRVISAGWAARFHAIGALTSFVAWLLQLVLRLRGCC
ncbi:MAG: hypothetical protein M1833_002215 [Piccolia ochrophora]|nr:MAG: hypothetical protein M1833_002215 [Piccolia ochrophora]